MADSLSHLREAITLAQIHHDKNCPPHRPFVYKAWNKAWVVSCEGCMCVFGQHVVARRDTWEEAFKVAEGHAISWY